MKSELSSSTPKLRWSCIDSESVERSEGDLQKRKQRFASSPFYCELPKLWTFFFHTFKFSVAYKPFRLCYFHFVRWTRFEGSCIAFQCSLILHAYCYWKRNMNWPIKCGLAWVVPHPHIDTSTVTLLHFRFCIVFGPSDFTVEGWYFQSTFMTICCLLIVLCIRGLPSRICHAAHTPKQ